MNDSYFAAVTWRARQESLDECTSRAEGFFSSLAECAPDFGQWFKLGRSRRDALKHQITPDAVTLRKLLLAGRNRTDVGRKVIQELGFSLGLWNGGNDCELVGLNIGCGAYGDGTSNACSIHLPKGGLPAQRLLRAPVLAQVLTCMVNAWAPDDGLVGSHGYRDIRADLADGFPGVGWLIYVSNRLGRVPLVPAPSTVTPVGDKGSLIIVTPERFDVGNPAHVEAADRVGAALDRAGLRKPLTPDAGARS